MIVDSEVDSVDTLELSDSEKLDQANVEWRRQAALLRRAEGILEDVIGIDLLLRLKASEALHYDEYMREAVRHTNAWQDSNMGSFTVDLDVKGASPTSTKDGVLLTVKLVADMTPDMVAVLGKLALLQFGGGTQVRFIPGVIQERLSFDPPGAPMPEHIDTRRREPDNGQAAADMFDENQGDAEDAIQEPAPLHTRRARGQRGATPISPEPDARGV